jgi:pimeloyl-ACP methyl ester carboxylesterase
LDWAARDSHAYRAAREQRMGQYRAGWRERDDKALLSLAADFGDVADWLDFVRGWNDDRFEPNMACNTALGADSVARVEWAKGFVADLALPVLLVHGELDPRPAPAELAACIPGARIEMLADVGHYLWAQHPDRLRASLRRFVTDVAASPSPRSPG